MSYQISLPNTLARKKPASFRLCNVSGHPTELLEIVSHDPPPALHLLFIPGNPAIGHISHSKKDWEKGRLFSLQEQIDHKADFVRQEMQNVEVPIVLVGHSIGSYISLEMLRRCSGKVTYFLGLYPFLMVNQQSRAQSVIGNIAESSILSAILSCAAASLGLLPKIASRLIVSKTIGNSWSDTAIEASCSHLLQYHTVRNMLFMAMTEFREVILLATDKLAEKPDWAFVRKNGDKIAFLFGEDDHWGPLHMFEEVSFQFGGYGLVLNPVPCLQISKQVPDIPLSIEREGHIHAFSCTDAGSIWVAKHVATLIKNQISSLSFLG
ncbi:hypothetical protein Tsubulata_015302 [Turnera subulata]|uniref:Uncharacterized protein n=1 Tax=Turnera subulata TaxID=218843 RepID=A0A9Q0JCC8_9ROSI|nr:hypothetical protein Tsubulata_015302 [Turnera subulata]